MADHTIEADEVGIHNVTLVAATVDTFTFEKDPEAIEVLTDGEAEVYVTVDGSAPTVGGAHTWKLPAVVCSRRIAHRRNPAVVKVISAGTPTISITRA